MKAALLYGKGDLRTQDVDDPAINAGEILLRVKSSFICGTDIRMFKNGYKNVSKDSPLILGHELSGVIEKVGENVEKYQPGMRVAVAPNMGCGICKMCTSGNTQLCPDYQALGINIDGGFAELVRIPEPAVRQGNVMLIADNVAFGDAALAEPLSCVYNAFERCNIKPGDRVLIIGAGPIGIMHAKLAKMAGAASIYINDLNEERLDVCKEIDASFETITNGVDLKEKVMLLTGGKGVDVCITACPAPSAQEISFQLMAVNGRVIFFGGLPAGTTVNLDTNIIHYKQLIVSGTTRSSLAHYRKTLELISSGQLYVRDIITSTVSIDNFEDALKSASQAVGLKSMVSFEKEENICEYMGEKVKQPSRIIKEAPIAKKKECAGRD